MTAKKKPEGYISRPSNCFLLYRSFKNKQYQKEHPGGVQSNFSKMISPLWAAEPPHVKAYWKERAKEVARKHKQKYPFYTFKPVQTKRKQTGHVLKHEDEGTRAPSAEGHSLMGLSDGLGSPPSPPDLSFSSSGSSSSARTTPGLNTPPSALDFWPLDGQSNQPQVSAQADMYGQVVQYQYTSSMEERGGHAQQQMLAQDRTYVNEDTASRRQRPGPGATSRGNPYARAAPPPNAYVQQDNGVYWPALQFTGNPQAAFHPQMYDYAEGYQPAAPQQIAPAPPQVMQRRVAAPQQYQTPQPPRFDVDFAPLDAVFCDFAAMPQLNGAPPAYLQPQPVQPQVPPVSAALNVQGYNYPDGSNVWPMQAGREPSSSSMPARPRAPAVGRAEQWGMGPVPSYRFPGQQFPANTGDSSDLAPYGAPTTGFSSQHSYVPMGPLSDVTAETADVPFNSFDFGPSNSSPSAASASIPYGAVEPSSRFRLNTNYAPVVGDQGATDQEFEAPLTMTRPLAVMESDSSPSSNLYDPLKTPPADAIWPEDLPTSESTDPFHGFELSSVAMRAYGPALGLSVVLHYRLDDSTPLHVLWIRWYTFDEWADWGVDSCRLLRVAFAPLEDEPFGFIPPYEVLRVVHYLPAFALGRSDAGLPGHSIARPANQDDEDYDYYYIGPVVSVIVLPPSDRSHIVCLGETRMFVDWDMIMRYLGGAVGHRGPLRASSTITGLDGLDDDDIENGDAMDVDDVPDNSPQQYEQLPAAPPSDDDIDDDGEEAVVPGGEETGDKELDYGYVPSDDDDDPPDVAAVVGEEDNKLENEYEGFARPWRYLSMSQ
ncbi:hypothetical protein VTO73DRAFT_10851 [Trametes versicolor]